MLQLNAKALWRRINTMIEVTVAVDEAVMEVLQTLADIKGISVADVLSGMVLEDIERIKNRLNDPMIGLFHSGRGDLSERDEEILRENWHPD
jgi:hypothetical protein